MWIRHALVLVGLIGSVSPVFAQDARQNDFRIDEVSAARTVEVARLKPGTIEFSDQTSIGALNSETALVHFDDWASQHPNEKKFIALFPSYTEPTVNKAVNGKAEPAVEKLQMYVAQARFLVSRSPAAIDLPRYATLAFLEKVDPSIKHTVIAAADVSPLKDEAGTGNDNPDRKWCTQRTMLICIQSTYKFEGKIPIGIMLVNKLRDSAKKVSDHIDFQSELSALSLADVDQAGLRELTKLDTPISGVIEQNIFYVNQIMKFGKFFAVFQADPADANKTVVTAFMSLAIKASVLNERRSFEKVPVLRNLVPAQVLMGQSSFNSGDSLSAGLPKYARNEIRTIASLLEKDAK
jgi:hypothetical protein